MCKNKTFSIQVVSIGNDENIIQVPVFGKFKCSMNALWYIHNGNAERLVQLKSPQFRLKYSSGVVYNPNGTLNQFLSASPYPVFLTTQTHQIGGLNGTIEWEAEFNGYIQLEMINLLNNNHPVDDSDVCVMNINLEPIHE
jgi:hypothetical protein